MLPRKLWLIRCVAVVALPVAILWGFAEEFWLALKLGWKHARYCVEDFCQVWRTGEFD